MSHAKGLKSHREMQGRCYARARWQHNMLPQSGFTLCRNARRHPHARLDVCNGGGAIKCTSPCSAPYGGGGLALRLSNARTRYVTHRGGMLMRVHACACSRSLSNRCVSLPPTPPPQPAHISSSSSSQQNRGCHRRSASRGTTLCASPPNTDAQHPSDKRHRG